MFIKESLGLVDKVLASLSRKPSRVYDLFRFLMIMAPELISSKKWSKEWFK
jgi:hypothetical protein